MTPVADILERLQEIAPVEVLPYRDGGGWRVEWHHVEIKDGCILRGVRGDGASYAEAVRDCWSAINALPSDQCFVAYAEWLGDKRRLFRWGGDRWVDVPPRRRAA